jgi:CHASE2 domain-containing sensor protein
MPWSVVAWDGWLARDVDSSDLENFPFALTVSTILLIGIAAIGWGVIVSSAWVTVLGILIALVGCVLYGWSLYDDRDYS